jgi:predicted enzyme related to lactoylglutathione lyase
MPGPARAGALLYAKDLERLSRFYQQVLGRRLLNASAERHILEAEGLQLILHALPPEWDAQVAVSDPPRMRSEAAIKLFFSVPSIAAAEAAMTAYEAGCWGPTYSGPGFVVRNATDAEGNVFQMREWRSNAAA